MNMPVLRAIQWQIENSAVICAICVYCLSKFVSRIRGCEEVETQITQIFADKRSKVSSIRKLSSPERLCDNLRNLRLFSLSSCIVRRIAFCLVTILCDSNVVCGQSTAAMDLNEIQAQVSAILPKIGPAVVCIEAGGGSGSGVIVDESGLILTAAHVIDKSSDLTIVYPDGRRFKGKSLGTYGPADAGMAQILEGAPHPFVKVAPPDTITLGQTALAMGHPGGFDQSRGAPLRIGHITQIDPNFISVDAALIGGDSGGPSFDLQGRVIGIHSHINQQVDVNRDGRIEAFHVAWDSMKAGNHDEVHYSKAVGSGDSSPDSPQPEQPSEPKEKSERASQLKELAELAKAKGGKLKMDREQLMKLRQDLASQTDALAPSTGSRIRDTWATTWNKTFSGHCERNMNAICKVMVSGRQVALASSASRRGHWLTKASEVKGRAVTVQLNSGKTKPAEILAVDDSLDLALLKIDQTDESSAQPVLQWQDDDHPKGDKGTLCAAIGTSSAPVGFGIISVANRPLNGKSGAFLGVSFKLLESGSGLQVEEIKTNSPAIRAGLRKADHLTAADGCQLKSIDQLTEIIAAHVPGDELRLDVMRDQTQLSIVVTLGDGAKLAPMPGNREQAMDSMTAKLSKRRWFFSTGIQHDCAIAAKDCGGPLLDLQGNLIGLNIARAGRIHSYAIPRADVMLFLEKHLIESEAK